MSGEKTKRLVCKCCDEEIDNESFNIWQSSDGLFCSIDCIARWYGDEIDCTEESYDELIDLFGVEVSDDED